ncbi:hypothetical protein BT69DRAFT_1306268 [Atractiella rhizophila]|nr:hypothetical protein BT69DRAFT_1306268 [Atractiella rhizophila]
MTGKWVQAGKDVRTIFQNPKVQLLLGLAINMEVLEPRDRTGEIKIAPQNKQLAMKTLSWHTFLIVNKDEPIHAGSWVLATAMDSQGFPMVTKVVEILRLEQQTPDGSKSRLSILALPYAVDAMYLRFYMPALAPTSAKPFHLPLNVITAPCGFDCSTPTIAQLRAILTLYRVAAPKGKLKKSWHMNVHMKRRSEKMWMCKEAREYNYQQIWRPAWEGKKSEVHSQV